MDVSVYPITWKLRTPLRPLREIEAVENGVSDDLYSVYRRFMICSSWQSLRGRKRWAGRVAGMGRRENACRVSTGTPE